MEEIRLGASLLYELASSILTNDNDADLVDIEDERHVVLLQTLLRTYSNFTKVLQQEHEQVIQQSRIIQPNGTDRYYHHHHRQHARFLANILQNLERQIMDQLEKSVNTGESPRIIDIYTRNPVMRASVRTILRYFGVLLAASY